MENLISMTDYVLYKYEKIDQVPNQKDLVNMVLDLVNYAKFLSMPLELKMFVPCDSENNVLEEPNIENFDNGVGIEYQNFESYKIEFEKGKSEVLFEGFNVNYTNESGSFEIVDDNDVQVYYYKSIPKYGLWLGSQKEKTIEHMITYNLKLTTNAKLKYKF